MLSRLFDWFNDTTIPLTTVELLKKYKFEEGPHYLLVFHPGDVSAAICKNLCEGLARHGISCTILRSRGVPTITKFEHVKEIENE